jgi:hypothetical protein
VGGTRREFSLDDYAHQRGEDLHGCGAFVHPFLITDLGDNVITVSASLSFGKELQGRLTIFEAIEIVNGRPHRRKYGYQLTYRDEFIARYDRDRQHAKMAEHKHTGRLRRRRPWSRVTLGEVIDEMWRIVREREAEEAKAAISAESGEGAA